MKNQKFEEEVTALLGQERLKIDEPLKRYTTWRVGGVADYFVETKTTAEVVDVLGTARKHDVPVFVLGGGANILVGDKGIRGLVLRNIANDYDIIGDLHGSEQQQTMYHLMVTKWEDHAAGEYRHKPIHYHFYDDRDANVGADSVFIRIASGSVMSQFIDEMYKQGITGLEKFARIPGTFGGWVYNNVHGHNQFIGGFVHSITYIDKHQVMHEKTWDELDFSYNHSRFHGRDDVILEGVVRMYRGNVELGKAAYKDALVKKLERQPGNSGGSVFSNLSSEDVERNGFESDSIGFVMDKVLDWNGKQKVGGAWISQKNGNFIETDQTATAADIVALIDIIKGEFRKKFQIELKEEFFRVGDF